MSIVLELGIRLLRWFLNQHFHVSRLMYLLIGAAGILLVVAAGSSAVGVIVGLVGIALSVQGLIHWWVISGSKPVLAVAVFASADRERALEVQRTVMTTLEDHLGRSFPLSIIAIPETLAGAEWRFASVLRRRLRTMYLLFGDIRLSPSGDVAVYPRVMEPSRGPIKHIDEFTHEAIPQRTIWQEVLLRLTSGVADFQVEYPFEFATEIVVILRGLEGKAHLILGDYRGAATFLEEALQPVRSSLSYAIDDIRVDLAKALDGMGEREKAIALLRKRADRGSASSDLLRHLAMLLVARPFGLLPEAYAPASAARYEQAIRWLRVAAADESDPERDLTRYNLEQLLASAGRDDEAEKIVDDLLSSRRSHYYRAWYLLRIKGVANWSRALGRKESGDVDAARTAFAMAGSFYARAIWRRPKINYIPATRFHAPRLQHIPIPPKMYANAFDAYLESGYRLRARFLLWGEKRARHRFLKKGERALVQRRFEEADAYFDWAGVGRNDDWDLHAHLGRYISQAGMARQDRKHGREAKAAEHEEPAKAHLQQAFAIDAKCARETLEKMTGLGLSQLDAQDGPSEHHEEDGAPLAE